MNLSDSSIHVVKLGGSLLDLPDVFDRFDRWCDREAISRGVLIVGGGAAADAVRAFDRVHDVGEVKGHELAVEAMRFNTLMVAARLARCRLVECAAECDDAWGMGEIAVVEPVRWLDGDDSVPRRWTFTSDSIAAHVATRLSADRLTLLKSTLPEKECGVSCAVGLGIVDEDFEVASAAVGRIELLNLRDDAMPACALK